MVGVYGHNQRTPSRPIGDREHQHYDLAGPMLAHAATADVRTARQSSGP